MTRALPLTWTLDVDVPVDSALHRVVRQTLEQRPSDRRPLHRAVTGALGTLLGRPLPLQAAMHGDAVGVDHVRVALPPGPRRALRLVVAAIPSRWRWRSDGDALVGRGPRAVTPLQDRPVGLVAVAFAFPDHLHEIVLKQLPVPVRGLRSGELVLTDVTSDGGDVRFRLQFDDAERAAAAAPGVEALLANVAVEHATHGLRYDGSWSLDGPCVVGEYRGTPSPDWPTVIDRLLDAQRSARTEDPPVAGSVRAG